MVRYNIQFWDYNRTTNQVFILPWFRHPDKVSEEDKEEAEAIFIEYTKAYKVYVS